VNSGRHPVASHGDGTVILDDLALIERGDPLKARDVLAGFPRQCREAVRLRATPALEIARPSLVVLAGMGGSAAGGDLVAACAGERLDVPVVVHRGYGLPHTASGRALVVAASYSGGTVEVLSTVDAALERRLALAVVTSGGPLRERAERHGLPTVLLPAGLMPRMALGYLLFAGLTLMRDAGLEVATEAETAEAVDVVDGLARGLAPERPSADNEAKRLALAIGERLPAVYGGPVTEPVAYRWKTDFEENAKAFALSGAVPEMNHNAIEAWRTPRARDVQLVLLRDVEEPPAIARRFAVLRELVSPAAGGVSECRARGRGRLARLLSLAYIGQWTSYYLAILRGVDPWTVPLLDELKRRIAR
jgi:glucose/mannose-6-phosphate isomerase